MFARCTQLLTLLACSLTPLLGLASSAAASPSYSAVVQRTFELDCAPSCLLCHTDKTGGFATANTKLGVRLRREYDAECCDDKLLTSILDELARTDTDSDGDGTSDADELRSFRDPNAVDSSEQPTELSCQPTEASGCATLVQAGAPRALWSGFGLLLLSSWCVRRYRRAA